MNLLTIALLAGLAAVLSGCNSVEGSGRSGLSEVSTGLGTFRQSSDTLGTQRRMDVYGGATAPVLPSIGTPGLGK